MRDLASRNGTFVDGERIASGSDVTLARGVTLAFGGADQAAFVFEDDGPPGPTARDVATGETHAGSELSLSLPDRERPRALVCRQGDGWILDDGDGCRPVADRELVLVDGRRFEILVPLLLPETAEACVSLADVREISFGVSHDQEYVRLDIATASRSFTFEHRAHHETLLTLARARLKDRARGMAASEEGWTHIDDLAVASGREPERIDLDVFRARHAIAEAGITDAAAIVERRRGARQLRLGLPHVVIRAL